MRVRSGTGGIHDRLNPLPGEGDEMLRFRSIAAAAVTVTLFGTTGAAGASSGPPSVDSRVNALLARMTLTEKLEQLQLLPDFMVTDDEVRAGLGSAFSLTDPVRINQLQHIAVEQS